LNLKYDASIEKPVYRHNEKEKLEELYEGLTLKDGNDEFIDVSPLKSTKQIVPFSKQIFELKPEETVALYEVCVHT